MKVYSLVFIVLLSSCSIHKLTKEGNYKEVSAEKFLSYVNDSTINLIDVRTSAEFEKSHIKGAININYFRGHFVNDLKELNLDTSKTTLIYCETQHRSLFVARKIKKAGFSTVLDLDKGMMKWRKNGFPSEK